MTTPKAPEGEPPAPPKTPPKVAAVGPQVEWTNPRSGEVKRLTFWQGLAQGVSLMLLCTDSEGRFRAYRAEECRAVLP